MGHQPQMLERVLWHHDHFWRRLLPVGKDTPILEIGCGDGFFLLYLKQNEFTALHGVDGSPDQVAAAHKAGLDQVVCGQALEYLARFDAYFGVVSAQNLLEHLALEELFPLLDATHKALRKGGELWIVVPNGLSPVGTTVRYSDLTHETCFTPQSIIQALRVCGFTNVRVREFGTPIVHGPVSLVRFALWRIIRSLLHLWRLVEFGEVGPAAVFTHDMQVIATKNETTSLTGVSE